MKIARRCCCGRTVIIDEEEVSLQHEGDACKWFRSILLDSGFLELDEPGIFVVLPDGTVMQPGDS
jgi:hypothetical protein